MQGLRVLGFDLDPEDAHLREQASPVLPQLIQQARALADYVIVDTPPLGEVSDALRLGRAVDGTLVVIRPGSTSRSQLRSTRELLERSGYFVEGAVIMGAADAPNRAYGYGYSEGYGIGGVRRSRGATRPPAQRSRSTQRADGRPTESDRR